MLKTFQLLSVIGWLLFSSCSWPKKALQEASAYYMTTNSGTVAIDEKGNEQTPSQKTLIVIYVQTKSTELTWDTAWFNEKPYPVRNRTQLAKGFEAGFNSSGEKITLEAKPGFFLYQLQVEPAITITTELPVSILLRANYKGKKKIHKIMPIGRIIPFEAG